MKTQQEIEQLAEQWFENANTDRWGGEIDGFIQGYSQCQEDIGFGNEKMYSDEDMQDYVEFCIRCNQKGLPCIIAKDWFKQFKKK